LERGRHVATFDWAQSLGTRRNRDVPLEDIGACLTLAAYKRDEVPDGFIQKAGDFEFAVRIPVEILEEHAERLIDIDESLPFKLALRCPPAN
jgi:hypothetical protein